MQNQVLEKIKGAFERFSKESGVEIKKVSIIVKPNEDFEPTYYKVINGTIEKDENGDWKPLHFNKDILGVKFSVLPIEYIVGQKLSSSMKAYMGVYEIKEEEIMLRIVSIDENANSLGMVVYKDKEVKRTLTAKEFFDN